MCYKYTKLITNVDLFIVTNVYKQKKGVTKTPFKYLYIN